MVCRPERTLILFLVILALAPSASAAGDIVPHHAEFTVVLTPTGDRPALSGRGRMVQQIRESCEGRSLRRETRLRLDFADGRAATNIVTQEFWEARNGRRLRFSIVDRVGDRVRRHFEGAARLPGNGKPGTARFTAPGPKTVTLPPETLFVFSFMGRYLELLRAKNRRRAFLVFRGDSRDSRPLRVIVRTLAKSPLAVGTPMGDRALIEKRPRVLEFLYYSSSDAALTPLYSGVAALQGNGVTRDFAVEIGRVRSTYTLKRIRALPRATCRGARNGVAPRKK